MAASDTGANLVLDNAVTGNTYLGLALSVDSTLTTITQADGTYLGTPRVLIPGGSSGWNSASARQKTAKNDVSLGLALQTFTPTFWVLWSASTGGTALWARRVNDVTAYSGEPVTVPASTIRLVYTGF